MTEPRQLLSGAPDPEELNVERSLRPRRLEEFIGQERVVDKLKVFLQAAREHVRLSDRVALLRATLEGRSGANQGDFLEMRSLVIGLEQGR